MHTVLGILSDSHSDVARTRHAIELLQAQGATRFVHCGDVETEAVIDLLAGLDAQITWGNCDQPRSMGRYAQALGIHAPYPLGDITVDGVEIEEAYWFPAGKLPQLPDKISIARRLIDAALGEMAAEARR